MHGDVRVMRRIAKLASITIGLGLGLASASPALADLVTLVPNSTVKAPGGVLRGTVTTESPTEIKVKIGANEQAVPVSQIASIRYDGSPPSLALAQAREASGNLAEAADLYKKCATEAATKPMIVEDSLFQQARLVAELGLNDPAKADPGAALLEGFLRTYANGRHVVPALEALAKLQLQKGSFDAAGATIERLAKIPETADRAAVLRARVAGKKGDHATSISELDTIIASAPENSAKKRDAMLAKAESLAALKKYKEAEDLVRSVIKSAPAEDFATQASAHNTLGDCLRAAGNPRDALYAYLHTDVLFFKDKEEHPKALSKIAQLWRELKRDDRADEVIERLKQEYPKSPYSAAAAAAAKSAG
jgi:tetratricopeptide (TPR) repeat protein